MHSSWYCRRRIFNGGPTGLTIEEAVACRRRTREFEHNLHFWRRVNNPLDAGGMSEALSVPRLNDIESVVHLRSFRAWRGPTRIPARISSSDKISGLLYSVSTASSTFYFHARRLYPPGSPVLSASHQNPLLPILSLFHQLEIMPSVIQLTLFHQDRLKYWQLQENGP
jgi:hypothetical protein